MPDCVNEHWESGHIILSRGPDSHIVLDGGIAQREVALLFGLSEIRYVPATSMGTQVEKRIESVLNQKAQAVRASRFHFPKEL